MKNSSVKQNNRSDILSVIMARQPVSRKQVSELLEISPAAVTNIVDELISSGLVVEGAFGEASAVVAGVPFFCESVRKQDWCLQLLSVCKMRGYQFVI